MSQFDLVVIGSGPGGYVAAIRAGQLGLKTALVEKDSQLGGTCLLRGCIPTKVMLHSADLLSEAKSAKGFGVDIGSCEVNFDGVQSKKNSIVLKKAKGVEFLMKKNKVQVFSGTGSFIDKQTLEVSSNGKKEKIQSKWFLIAAGSVPRVIKGLKIDGEKILTSDEILSLKTIPKTLGILGAGAIGVEFASMFHRFGSKVTLVEMLPNVLPIEDAEISSALEKELKKQGITIYTNTKLEDIRVDKKVTASLVSNNKQLEKLEVDSLLLAIGRVPNTEKLALEKVGVKTDDRGYIQVDQFLKTNVPNIYAIGDIVPTPWLAHVASKEGIVAVEHMAGKNPRPLNYDHVPSCTYCDPEVASVGLTEAKANARGYSVKVSKFPFAAAGKAACIGHTEGFVKIVGETKYDELLGVHIIGPAATEIISEACVALSLESTTAALANVMHAHPTLAEAIMEAAEGVTGQIINM